MEVINSLLQHPLTKLILVFPLIPIIKKGYEIFFNLEIEKLILPTFERHFFTFFQQLIKHSAFFLLIFLYSTFLYFSIDTSSSMYAFLAKGIPYILVILFIFMLILLIFLSVVKNPKTLEGKKLKLFLQVVLYIYLITGFLFFMFLFQYVLGSFKGNTLETTFTNIVYSIVTWIIFVFPLIKVVKTYKRLKKPTYIFEICIERPEKDLCILKSINKSKLILVNHKEYEYNKDPNSYKEYYFLEMKEQKYYHFILVDESNL